MNLNHFIVADDIGDSLADALRVYVVEIGYLCIVSISSSLLKQQNEVNDRWDVDRDDRSEKKREYKSTARRRDRLRRRMRSSLELGKFFRKLRDSAPAGWTSGVPIRKHSKSNVFSK
ncbi:hypothetical protein FXO37_33738 [Capsicum annuum]|nr:hypothetical protein FXO37_33738 [Capsicum annuum]